MKVLAIDLGGTHANCAIVEDKQVVRSQLVRTSGHRRLEFTLPEFSKTLRALTAVEMMDFDDFAGVAIGFCGLIDGSTNRVVSTNAKYEDAPDLDLQAWATQELGLPLWLENDARTALLGEWHAGSAMGFDDVVIVTLGTGIGTAAMIDGRLLTGKHFQAGCLGGHFPVRLEDTRCTCGAVGAQNRKQLAMPGQAGGK